MHSHIGRINVIMEEVKVENLEVEARMEEKDEGALMEEEDII